MADTHSSCFDPNTYYQLTVVYKKEDKMITVTDRYKDLANLKERIEHWQSKGCYFAHNVYLVTEQLLNL